MIKKKQVCNIIPAMKTGRFLVKILFLLILGLSLSGCFKQDYPAISASLQKNLDAAFENYKRSMNKLDRLGLNDLLSEQFIYYGGGKQKYIDENLKRTIYIDNISYRVSAVDDFKVYAEAKITGTLVYKPQVNLPLFAKQITLLQGSFENTSLFVLAYEKDALKFIGQQEGLSTKVFQKGFQLPEIKTFTLDKYAAAPGDTLKIHFSIDKGPNDIAFGFINEHLLSGFSDRGEVPYNEDSFAVNIPHSHPHGKPFDVSAMVFAGKMEIANPQQAELQGVVIKTISVPVQ